MRFNSKLLPYLVTILFTAISFQTKAMIQGQPVDENDPIGQSMAGILIDEPGVRMSYCSGTLVGSQTVLTAAHCFKGFKNYKVFVIFGNNPFRYASDATDESQKLRLKSEDEFHAHFSKMKRALSPVLIHPDYKNPKADFASDIALVRLKDPAPDGIQSIPLLPENERLLLTDKLTVLSSGLNQFSDGPLPWNRLIETELKKASFPIVTDISQYVSRIMDPFWRFEALPGMGSSGLSQDLILIDEANSEKLTLGDSGASALVFKGAKPYVAGVLSEQHWYGNPVEIFGGLFARTQSPLKAKWLKENIK